MKKNYGVPPQIHRMIIWFLDDVSGFENVVGVSCLTMLLVLTTEPLPLPFPLRSASVRVRQGLSDPSLIQLDEFVVLPSEETEVVLAALAYGFWLVV